MVTYQTSIRIQRPAPAVFAVMNDLDRVPQWLTGLKKVEALAGKPGQAGFRSRYTFEENGREVIFHEEVTEVRPPEYIAQRLESDSLQMESHIRIIAQGDDAEIRIVNQVRGKTLAMRLMLPLFRGVMRRRQEGDLGKLKRLAEGA